MKFPYEFRHPSLILPFLCYHYEGRFHPEKCVKAKKEDYKAAIATAEMGNAEIASLIRCGEPKCVSRLGATELAMLDFWTTNRNGTNATVNFFDRWLCFQSIKYRGWRGSGVFPPKSKIFDRFCELYAKCLGNVDLMAVWYNYHEELIVQKYAPNAELCELTSLEPYYHESPWSKELSGKRVLVIHPFAESIRRQYYDKRDLLFKNQDVLPLFELETIPAVQSLLLKPAGFRDWFEALDSMKMAMQKSRFDVAIIGAGAYGLPLSTYAKELGRISVQIAGATQILFGIRGRRWETHEKISKLFNDNWVRPSATETPITASRQESGCYW